MICLIYCCIRRMLQSLSCTCGDVQLINSDVYGISVYNHCPKKKKKKTQSAGPSEVRGRAQVSEVTLFVTLCHCIISRITKYDMHFPFEMFNNVDLLFKKLSQVRYSNSKPSLQIKKLCFGSQVVLFCLLYIYI